MSAAVKLDVHRDKRRSPRRVVIEDAWIVDKRGGWSLIDCTIRDLSAGGARIEIDSSVEIPTCFDLLLEKELHIIPVRIRWRRRNFLGVEFVGEPRQAPPFRLC